MSKEPQPPSCVACEDHPTGSNNPCVVCGLRATTHTDALSDELKTAISPASHNRRTGRGIKMKKIPKFDIRIIDRYAGDGSGERETDARMVESAHGRYVLATDYADLLGKVGTFEATEVPLNHITLLLERSSAELIYMREELDRLYKKHNESAEIIFDESITKDIDHLLMRLGS